MDAEQIVNEIITLNSFPLVWSTASVCTCRDLGLRKKVFNLLLQKYDGNLDVIKRIVDNPVAQA